MVNLIRNFTFATTFNKPMLFEKILQEPTLLTLFIIFASAAFIQLLYLWVLFGRFAFSRKKYVSNSLPPATIVITAHNQISGLEENLLLYLGQDYPNFEVLVVNDNSDDGSGDLLKEYMQIYPRLHIVELTQSLNWFKGKKFPLSLGIKSANNDLVVITDAHCKPASHLWLQEMVSAYKPETEIVLGYSTYDIPSKINIWLRFWNFFDALFYFAMAQWGMPFKGVGKNLSYRRKLFYKQKGFISHYTISVGDDELFINKAATSKNTSWRISKDSVMRSVKEITFGAWWKKEITRLMLREYFKTGHRFILSFNALTIIVFYVLFVVLLTLKAGWIMILSIFVLRLISQLIVYGYAQKRFGEKKLLLLTPFFEIFLMLIDIIIWVGLLFTKRKPGLN